MNQAETHFMENQNMEQLMAHGRLLHDRAVFQQAAGLVTGILRSFKKAAASHETGTPDLSLSTRSR